VDFKNTRVLLRENRQAVIFQIFRRETVQLPVLRQGFHEKRFFEAARAHPHWSETF